MIIRLDFMQEKQAMWDWTIGELRYEQPLASALPHSSAESINRVKTVARAVMLPLSCFVRDTAYVVVITDYFT